MITRLANVETDAPEIMLGVYDFIGRMDFTDCLPEGLEGIEDTVLALVDSDVVEVAVVEDEDKIIAGLGVAYVPFLWNPAVLQADELFWWGSATQTTAAMRVLRFTLERMRERAGDRQAMAVFHKLTSSPASVAAIYRRLGLREVQTSYMGII